MNNFHSHNLLFSRNIYSILTLLLVLSSCHNSNKQPLIHSPEYELNLFQFADKNLEATLIASEPNIISPVDIAWAPDGALFVAEMPGYPTTKDKGSVKKLVDADGDGYYEKMSVFDGDLNFPTSVMYYQGGLLIADAPNIYYLKDLDGDGIADEKEILLTGFTKGNEQLLVNALQWGLDNMIYGANGRSGGKVKFSGKNTETSIDNRDFRFNPASDTFEAISGMSQFGMAHDNWGNRFLSYNHRFARQVILEENHLAKNPSLVTEAVFDTYQDEHDRKVYTLLSETMRFNRDPIGYFTSLSGLTAYRGDLLGPSYENSFFAGESVQAAVIHRSMKPDGVTFSAIDTEENGEFLASTDDWFHPVNFSNGPDGALYMVDFYRKFVEHPEWAHKEKREGVDWNLGEDNGRIWRIAKEDAKLDQDRMSPNLHRLELEELVDQLADPAGWRRDMAQQLIVEREKKEASPYLLKMLHHENSLARLHALWTLEGLEMLETETLQLALNDEDSRIQVQAIRLAESRIGEENTNELLELVVDLSSHEDPQVRFNAILALGDSDNKLVQEILVNNAIKYNDFWTRIALLSSTANWAGDFAKALINPQNKSIKHTDKDYWFYSQIGKMAANVPDNSQSNNWVGQNTGQEEDINDLKIAFLAGYLEALNGTEKKMPSFSINFFNKVLDKYGSASNEIGKLGIGLLKYAKSEKIFERLLTITTETENNEISLAGIQTLSSLDRPKVSMALFKGLDALGPEARKELIASSLHSDAAAMSLLNALDEKGISPTEIPEELRQALLVHTNPEVKDKAALTLENAVDKNRQAVIDNYLASLGGQTVEVTKGANIFKNNCSTCHSVNGVGGLLGPDLTNIGNRSDEILLTSILDPSRMVSYELKLHVVTTKSGEVFSGTTSAETISSITIKQPNGQEHTILKENIEKQTVTDKSIMPEGYERLINEKDMADLIGFLRQPDAVDNNTD